jgi:hypothetical protein
VEVGVGVAEEAGGAAMAAVGIAAIAAIAGKQILRK